ncbi:MAG TPA: FecR domain-containing protein [Steroidobacter sp.]
MESSRREIEDRATELLQRRECGNWSREDEAELTRWLEESTANRVAFLRAEAAWEAMGRLKALGAGLLRRTVPTPEALEALQVGSVGERAARPAGSRYFRKVGIAATILVAVGLALAGSVLWFTGERYATPIGGVASVPLADGSRITLNSDSRVRVLFSERERYISLVRGEVYFEVAPDSNRPFVVDAGDRRVVAVGTKFAVRRETDELRVVVTEGRVRVENAEVPSVDEPKLATDQRNPSQLIASAGSVVRARQDEVIVNRHAPDEAEEILSWRNGYLSFRATPLKDAVAEFNRYNTRQIVIADENLAAMQLTGKFRATNNEAFVNLLQQTYGIEVMRTESRIVLSSPSATPHE